MHARIAFKELIQRSGWLHVTLMFDVWLKEIIIASFFFATSCDWARTSGMGAASIMVLSTRKLAGHESLKRVRAARRDERLLTRFLRGRKSKEHLPAKLRIKSRRIDKQLFQTRPQTDPTTIQIISKPPSCTIKHWSSITHRQSSIIQKTTNWQQTNFPKAAPNRFHDDPTHPPNNATHITKSIPKQSRLYPTTIQRDTKFK